MEGHRPGFHDEGPADLSEKPKWTIKKHLKIQTMLKLSPTLETNNMGAQWRGEEGEGGATTATYQCRY